MKAFAKRTKFFLHMMIIFSFVFAFFWLPHRIQAAPSVDNEPKKVIIFATRDILKGAVIREKDVGEKVIFARRTPLNTVPCQKYAVGMRTICTIRTGQVILDSYLNLRCLNTKEVVPMHVNCPKTTFVRARIAIPAGSIIHIGDLETRQISLDDDEPGWLSNANLIAGRMAKIAIARGQVLTYDLIEAKKGSSHVKKAPPS